MKKENRKMAQERRAKERQKQERKRIIKKVCSIGIPILLIAGLIILLVLDPSSSSSDTTGTNTTTDTSTSDTGSTTTTLSTDTSLTVENGDTVNIDYVGSVDGVEFEGGSTDGMGTDLVIGSGSYIDDFEDQLIGAHPGDTVDVYATFPENYGIEELNGQEALFVVTVNGIYR